jgi:high affinity Mn2+ porin
MNWSIWAAGAFDYGADKVGLGYGAWLISTRKTGAADGLLLVPSQSNANTFDGPCGAANGRA